jgi:hypothetical protein
MATKSIRWTEHADRSLVERQIDRQTAERTLRSPDLVTNVEGDSVRYVYQGKYFDSALGRPMLLRIIVEESLEEMVVVTLYRTSKLEKYGTGGANEDLLR